MVFKGQKTLLTFVYFLTALLDMLRKKDNHGLELHLEVGRSECDRRSISNSVVKAWRVVMEMLSDFI